MLRNISIGVLLAMAAMLGSYGVAAATLRCGSAIVSEGDLIDDVLRKCGNPDSRKIEGPAVDGSGYIVRGLLLSKTGYTDQGMDGTRSLGLSMED